MTERAERRWYWSVCHYQSTTVALSVFRDHSSVILLSVCLSASYVLACISRWHTCSFETLLFMWYARYRFETSYTVFLYQTFSEGIKRLLYDLDFEPLASADSYCPCLWKQKKILKKNIYICLPVDLINKSCWFFHGDFIYWAVSTSNKITCSGNVCHFPCQL